MVDTASAAQRDLPAAERLARQFHEAYERLAPKFHYATRPASRMFDPESSNGQLMIAVCEELLASRASAGAQEDVFPIARLYVEETEDGRSTHIAKATFYAPGLPTGAHDVYPVAGVMSPADTRPADVSQKGGEVNMSTRKALEAMPPLEGLRALIGGLRYCQEAAVEVGKDTIIEEIKSYGEAIRREALEEAAKVVHETAGSTWVDGSDQFGRPCPAKIVTSRSDYVAAIRAIAAKESTK